MLSIVHFLPLLYGEQVASSPKYTQLFPCQLLSFLWGLHDRKTWQRIGEKLTVAVLSQVMSDSATEWTATCQAPLSSTVSQSLLKFMSIESVLFFIISCNWSSDELSEYCLDHDQVLWLSLETCVDFYFNHALAGRLVQESIAIHSCACRDLGERITEERRGVERWKLRVVVFPLRSQNTGFGTPGSGFEFWVLFCFPPWNFGQAI